ncbi:Mss4-like protein [Chaetomium sp. MPI-CAGE-AT-0009]|nr:Mss4-like protein [Chaetomium sp. MPI-CAGE-AT-0009]
MRSRFFRILLAFSNLTRPTTFRAAPRLSNTAPPLKSMNIPFLSALFGTSSPSSKNTMTSYPDQRTPDEWRAVLSPEQFRILREKGTERPGSGTYDKHQPAAGGTYACAGCGAALYAARHKFASGCGWPAYFDSLPGAVERHEDRSLGMVRTEIVCANCGGHLGHVFKGEGYDTPTDERHCVNSVSLTFREPGEGVGEAGAGKEAEGEGKGESKV